MAFQGLALSDCGVTERRGACLWPKRNEELLRSQLASGRGESKVLLIHPHLEMGKRRPRGSRTLTEVLQ